MGQTFGQRFIQRRIQVRCQTISLPAGLMASPAPGCVDQPATVFCNRIFRKCKTGIFTLNQAIMGDVHPKGSGVSPVTIDAGSVCFKMRGVAFNTAFMAFIKIRTCRPDKSHQNDYNKDTKAQFAPRKNMATTVSANINRKMNTVTILTHC